MVDSYREDCTLNEPFVSPEGEGEIRLPAIMCMAAVKTNVQPVSAKLNRLIIEVLALL